MEFSDDCVFCLVCAFRVSVYFRMVFEAIDVFGNGLFAFLFAVIVSLEAVLHVANDAFARPALDVR